MIEITSPDGLPLHLTILSREDGHRLGAFFEALSPETRQRYGPHPLTVNYAQFLCQRGEQDTSVRLILLHSHQVVGYFLFERPIQGKEVERYQTYGIALGAHDYSFAPVIADSHQSKGIATQVMPFLIQALKTRNARRLILMWGTQATNLRARRLYESAGFQEIGRFHTEVENIDMLLQLV